MNASELPEGAEIRITVAADGDVQIAVRGVKGGGCLGLTDPFRKATGEVVSSRRTAEFREEEETNEGSHKIRR